MVDVVSSRTLSMPSESDVRAARGFLTKILRSSMRRSEPASRPHSWHSSKLTEEGSEVNGSDPSTAAAAASVWQHNQHEARSVSAELPTHHRGEPGSDDVPLTSSGSQCSSASAADMERPEPPPSPTTKHHHHHPATGGSVEPTPKRESSGFSCLSSSPPDPPRGTGSSTSTENMFFKGPPEPQSGEGPPCRHAGREGGDQRSRYLQYGGNNGPGGWEGSSRGSGGEPDPHISGGGGGGSSRAAAWGRPGGAVAGPVWMVPDRKKTQSPPPPPPPLRSDSFAASKVFPYSEGPALGGPSKIPGGRGGGGGDRGGDPHKHHRNNNNNNVGHHEKAPAAAEVRRSFHAPLPPPPPPHVNKDFLYPGPTHHHHHHQLHHHHPNKLFSLSSSDVRQAPSSSSSALYYPPPPPPPSHRRQYSDESPFFQTSSSSSSSSSAWKLQSVASYYRSLQELPRGAPNSASSSSSSANRKQQQQTTARHSTNHHAAAAANQSTENGGGYRYLFVPSKHSGQPAADTRQGKAAGEPTTTTTPHWASNADDRSSFCSAKNNNNSNKTTKYSLAKCQAAYGDAKDRAGQHATVYDHHPPSSSSELPAPDGQKRVVEERSNDDDVKRHSPNQPRNQLSPSPRLDPQGLLWLPQDDQRISAQRTPLLHSLTQESVRGLQASSSERPPSGVGGAVTRQSPLPLRAEPPPAAAGGRRGDRYATALRHEIREKRAQLQKSRSAATLTCREEEEDEEEAEPWRSLETSSSTSCFSISYKDHLKEAQARVLQATSFQRRDLEPAGAETTAAAAKSSSSGVSRIGGRKRLPLAKRMHSFSEPDKIDKLGTAAEGGAKGGSFGERRRLFEARPVFARPALRLGQSGPAAPGPELSGEAAGKTSNQRTRTAVGEDYSQTGRPPSSWDRDKQAPSSSSSSSSLAAEQQQRLGTFAEYQAQWDMQRKRTKGRFHSAENILDDAGAEEKKAACVHERSRSSPSADFYSQNIPWRDVEEIHKEPQTPGQHNSDTIRGVEGNPEVRIQQQPPAPTAPLGSVGSAGSVCSLQNHPAHHRLSPSHSSSSSAAGLPPPVSPGPPGPPGPGGWASQPSQTQKSSGPQHSGPTAEKTSWSSQEFLLTGTTAVEAEAEAELRGSPGPVAAALPRPCSPRLPVATQGSCDGVSSPLGPGRTSGEPPSDPAPSLRKAAGGGGGGGDGGMERRTTPVITMEPPTPPCVCAPGSSDPSFSFLSFKTPQALFVPSSSSSSADGGRSPPPTSPLFVPPSSSSSADRGRSPSPLFVPTDGGRSPSPLFVPADGGRSPSPLFVPTDGGRSPSPLFVPADRGRSPSPLFVPTDRGRSPSPHFAPHQLTDSPPLAVESSPDDNAPVRSEVDPGEVTEVGGPVKKVPVKIVHSESSSERAGRAYLPPHDPGDRGTPDRGTPDPAATVAAPEGRRPSQIASLGSAESATPSPFSAYTRPGSQGGPPGGQGGPQWHRPSQDLGQSAFMSGMSNPAGSEGSDGTTRNVTTTGTPQQQQQLCEEDPQREALARDIMDRDTSLADIMRRTTMDHLMEGLLGDSMGLLEEAQQHRCRKGSSAAGPTPLLQGDGMGLLEEARQHRRKSSSSSAVGPAVVRHRDASTSPRTTEERREDGGSLLVPSSSYYNTSAPKAELLIMMKDMQGQMDDEGQAEEDELDQDLSTRKMELIDSLSRKLEVLREVRASLQEEVESNEALGGAVEGAVQRLCRPNQLERFRMFVGDLDKVVSLLLSLSGRLARVDNALNGLEEDGPAEEKRTLTEKRQLLMRQHEDAGELKENLERREGAVSAVMETQLDPESLDDYRHFVKMKARLIVEQRRLDDRIKLGEEQLACLVDSLPPEDRRRYY